MALPKTNSLALDLCIVLTAWSVLLVQIFNNKKKSKNVWFVFHSHCKLHNVSDDGFICENYFIIKDYNRGS